MVELGENYSAFETIREWFSFCFLKQKVINKILKKNNFKQKLYNGNRKEKITENVKPN